MAAMMSQPPTSSPPVYSCGKVGQSENFCAGGSGDHHPAMRSLDLTDAAKRPGSKGAKAQVVGEAVASMHIPSPADAARLMRLVSSTVCRALPAVGPHACKHRGRWHRAAHLHALPHSLVLEDVEVAERHVHAAQSGHHARAEAAPRRIRRALPCAQVSSISVHADSRCFGTAHAMPVHAGRVQGYREKAG